MAPRARRKHVVLAFPVSVPWMALSFRGITDYAKEHGNWDFITSPSTVSGAEELPLTALALRGLPTDGVIALVNDAAEARAARRLGVPVVNISGVLRNSRLPCVTPDHYAIGRLGAEHLLACGLRRLAYHGLEGPWYSRERRRGFVERAAEAGVSCEVFDMPPCTNPRASWRQRTAPLTAWLKTLRSPVGIMAVHDYRARVLADESLRLQRNVPHDVAILGVDNDATLCAYCQPTLSSVSRSAWRMGYEAASLLDRLMAGRPAPEGDILIAPDGVVARRSTDTIAVDDPHVSAAAHFMHNHVHEVFGIDRVMRHVPISRRWLESQFQRLLQCSPHEYLCRLRVEKAKQLLVEPECMKMQKVAAACGFAGPLRMRIVFRRLTGMTPQEYRRTLSRRGGKLAQ